MNVFSIYNYHWIWYILGFLFAPQLTLIILVCVYLPISVTFKTTLVILYLLMNSK